jgi:hypothetical protein
MAKTVGQILLEVRQHKTCSTVQLYRYFKRWGIQPEAVRQRPQRYPDDSAERILTHLGIEPESNIVDLPGHERFISDHELRTARKVAKTRGRK